jgi:tRNA-dihydrouridine synthase
MIGRGAYGAPWLPGRIAAALASGGPLVAPGLAEQGRIAIRHVVAMLTHHGREHGLRIARKHIAWYLAASGLGEAVVKTWRRRLCTDEDPARVERGLGQFYEAAMEVAA